MDTINGARYWRDRQEFKEVTLPASCVGDTEFDATDPLTATQQEHRHTGRLSQVHGSAATAERRVVHVARGDGTVEAVRAGVVVACVGDSTITVDVKKNGTSILSATIGLDSGDAAYAKVDGTVSTAAYVAGDVFEVVVTVAAGTGTLGQGLFVDVVFTEDQA